MSRRVDAPDAAAGIDAAAWEGGVPPLARPTLGAGIPSPPPSDLPVDIFRIRRLSEQWLPEPGVPWTRITWAVGAQPLGEGWDNVLWPVGDLDGQLLVARAARRSSARELLTREAVVLRYLAAQEAELTMRIPVPLATASDAMLIPWIRGTTAAEVGDAEQVAVAQELARMLAQVHSLATPQLERNPVRGVPLATRADAFAEDLRRADLDLELRLRALAHWEEGIAAPVWTLEDRLLHGDPHPGNVVVVDGLGSAGTAVGSARTVVGPARTAVGSARTAAVFAGTGAAALIDWGDATAGDPASDLGALLLHDPSGEILGAYRAAASWPGIEDDEMWDALSRRARAWGTRMALSLHGAYGPDHPLGRSGRRLLGE